MANYIKTSELSEKYRLSGVDTANQKTLITNLSDSEQSKDLTLPFNCNGFGRIRHFNRATTNGFIPNSLPLDPAQNALNLPFEDLVKVQLFQNAVCSWRCWYCFVDFKLLAANPKHSYFLSADELLDLYQSEKEQYPIIDLSGGQPDLVPEWSLWFADSLSKRGLSKSTYLWSDDNLSNDFIWKFLKKNEIKRLAENKNYGRVGCFKGFDHESFSFNTTSDPILFNRQFKIMKRLVDTGFDMYGYITLTTPNEEKIEEKISNFMDKIQQEIHPLFPLRIIPLQIFEFTPTKSRMKVEHYKSLELQRIAASAWDTEITKRFSQIDINKRIFEHNILR
jgi:uncharacterized Fe-S cluster-containing radical SAM superfamily protein